MCDTTQPLRQLIPGGPRTIRTELHVWKDGEKEQYVKDGRERREAVRIADRTRMVEKDGRTEALKRSEARSEFQRMHLRARRILENFLYMEWRETGNWPEDVNEVEELINGV